MRISIIGPTGGGKTTLAKKIRERFSIPHIQLDRFWFEAGGELNQTDEVKERVAQTMLTRLQTSLSAPDWVCDGTYVRLQPFIAGVADVVILVELPLYTRLWNHLVRIHHRRDAHPEVSYLRDWLYCFEIIRRRFAQRPQFERLSCDYADKLVRLRSYKEIDAYFEGMNG